MVGTDVENQMRRRDRTELAQDRTDQSGCRRLNVMPSAALIRRR